jgi:hypothetical protein
MTSSSMRDIGWGRRATAALLLALALCFHAKLVFLPALVFGPDAGWTAMSLGRIWAQCARPERIVP